MQSSITGMTSEKSVFAIVTMIVAVVFVFGSFPISHAHATYGSDYSNTGTYSDSQNDHNESYSHDDDEDDEDDSSHGYSENEDHEKDDDHSNDDDKNDDDHSSDDDSYEDDDEDDYTHTTTHCALTITKSVNKSTAKVGEHITYTLNFKNTGTANCTGGGVKVVDHLPAEVMYVSETHSSNVDAGYGTIPVNPSGSNSVYFNAHTLTPGESGYVTITTKIRERAQCGSFSFDNQGKTTAFELNNFGTWIYSNSVGVTVDNACHSEKPVPVCTLDASASTITRGGSATLSWTTNHATHVSLIGDVSAHEIGSGSLVVTPTETKTYTLTATGEGGTVTCVKTVTVHEPTSDPVVSCDAFTANPGTLTSAGKTTLTWSTTNATNVSIDNSVGVVLEDGSQEVTVNGNTTYTLTATRDGVTKTCSVPVTIVPNAIVPKCDAFTASQTSIREGQNVTLTWNTTDAASVSIDNGIGSVSEDGSKDVTPGSDTTYVLTATRDGKTTSCQISIQVDEDNNGGGGGGSSSPRCTLKASDTRITPGKKVTLSWKNVRTNDIILKDNRGEELIDTTEKADDEKYNEDDDSISVSPIKSTSYTMTAIKGSKKKSCTVDIKVEGVTVTSTRTVEPLVAGISLSRLPYTGFDAGPFLTTLFYVLLGLWALLVAYVLVLRNKTLPSHGNTLSTAQTHGLMAHTAAASSLTREDGAAPEVSRMGYVPEILTAPRVVPQHNVTSVHAPRGYEAYYESNTPEVVATASVAEIPNLPIGEVSHFDVAVPAPVTKEDLDQLEARAHDAHVLMSTDALNFIVGHSMNELERMELLDTVVQAAKAHYPKEDGWVVVNKDRIISLLK